MKPSDPSQATSRSDVSKCGLLGTITGRHEGSAKVDILLGKAPEWDDRGLELLSFMK